MFKKNYLETGLKYLNLNFKFTYLTTIFSKPAYLSFIRGIQVVCSRMFKLSFSKVESEW